MVDEDDVPVIVGDATDEDALMAAGIDRATSLIAALGDSSANLALVLTARSLREDLRIVARIADDRDERKFIRAGADRVVNPYDIGGSRMAAIAFRPHVAEFLDEVVHSEEHDVDIQEVLVAAGSPADGAEIDEVCDALVIAVKSSADGYVFGPSTRRRLSAGDVMIVVGAADEIARLAAATRAPTGQPRPRGARLSTERKPPQVCGGAISARWAASASTSSGSSMASICTASSAAFMAPSTATVATGMPFGICTVA